MERTSTRPIRTAPPVEVEPLVDVLWDDAVMDAGARSYNRAIGTVVGWDGWKAGRCPLLARLADERRRAHREGLVLSYLLADDVILDRGELDTPRR